MYLMTDRMNDSQEDDYHNFSTSPTHRLPTLNGAQALQDAIETRQPISTSLAALDHTLREFDDCDDELPVDGGIPRGSVTEVYGPPGCGKTAFAIQLAANALKGDSDAKVTWIDTCANFPFQRLRLFSEQISDAAQSEEAHPINGTGYDPDEMVHEDGTSSQQADLANEKFSHIHITSFPHLLAFLLHPSPAFPPEGTSLLILDDLSSISITGLPQRKNEPIPEVTEYLSTPAPTPGPTTPGHLNPSDIISKSLSARRLAMLSSISAGLQRLAALRNMAVVVLNNSTTNSNRKSGSKSVLRSMLSSQQWNENIATRIIIYRDHWPRINWRSFTREEARKRRRLHTFPLRTAEVERLEGQDVNTDGIKFVILKRRLHAVDPPKLNPVIVAVPPPSSPPFPGEDDGNEDAMQNLGLADVDEDQGLQMLEDAVSSSASQTGCRRSKREITEVADSEDEGEIEFSQAKLPPMPKAQGGFLPSSQLMQDEQSDLESPVRNPSLAQSEKTDPPKDDDDMLLQ